MVQGWRKAGCAVMVGLAACVGIAGPDLSIALGEHNQGEGLRVPSDGDGKNVPETVQGVSARRVADGTLYLYVAIEHPSFARAPADLYVQAEVFDDGVTRMTVQYDRAAPTPSIATCYTDAESTFVLIGSRQWRTLCFHLPDLRLGHGQNLGADLRFFAPNVAFRKITVSAERPASFDERQGIDPETLRRIAVTRAPGMELTFGNDATAADAALFKALTVTSVESYVDWAGVEPAKDQWDWSKWDKQVAVLRAAGLKWVPFLIAGPAYATPLWFQNSADSRTYRCLEHGKDSKVQSLFNPALRPQVERFLRAFAERYRDTGVIESVLLGVTGIYGESLYPAGPEGGWTAHLTGDYHNHFGWWAGDADAVAAFRAAMDKKYGRIKRLNAAWGTGYTSFDGVATFLPDKASNDRARADFAEWYQASMTEWAAFWVKSAREVFPKAELYLCTGGDGNPFLGADFTAQTAAAARYGAGVRITNEGSGYADNFSVTREVATATRHYGTFCGFEPAAEVNAGGVVARVYNATASGARQLHDYVPNTLGKGVEALDNFRANASWLMPRRPHVRAALYLSRETWALEPEAIDRTLALSRVLRDVADVDFVTRRSLEDGHLDGYAALVLCASSVLEPTSADAIEKWARKGGLLVAATRPGEVIGHRLYDQRQWRKRLFAEPTRVDGLVRPERVGPAPAHWALKVGNPEDGEWLFGDWNGREKGHAWSEMPEATMRWSGAKPGVWLPVAPGADHVVKVSLMVPDSALGATGIAVTVNGQPVGRIERPGKQDCAFAVSAAVLGSNDVARLELAATAWKPSAQKTASSDTRDLGVSVRQVEVMRTGADGSAPQSAQLRMAVDGAKLAACARSVGKGRTVLLDGRADDAELVARVLAHALPGLPDGRIDKTYATETDGGTLWFDANKPRIWESAK